ncbi:hypothetical protein BJ878DRAFT_477352 [Calycina marina]|uniref:Uncharacterized protein n=1 Tax=Calycina marina TaxID=1763456 RepID=A0A9P8CHM3_9HELO|nr:hypothetical protein BJ878DRAFT_477352 [Calycina marina]
MTGDAKQVRRHPDELDYPLFYTQVWLSNAVLGIPRSCSPTKMMALLSRSKLSWSEVLKTYHPQITLPPPIFLHSFDHHKFQALFHNPPPQRNAQQPYRSELNMTTQMITQVTGSQGIAASTASEAMSNSTWAFNGNTDYNSSFAVEINVMACSEAHLTVPSPLPKFEKKDTLVLRRNDSGFSLQAAQHSDTEASLLVNHSSAYDQSPADYQHLATPRFGGELEGPTMLESWANVEERHELLTYQGVRPSASAKKRKAVLNPTSKQQRKASGPHESYGAGAKVCDT